MRYAVWTESDKSAQHLLSACWWPRGFFCFWQFYCLHSLWDRYSRCTDDNWQAIESMENNESNPVDRPKQSNQKRFPSSATKPKWHGKSGKCSNWLNYYVIDAPKWRLNIAGNEIILHFHRIPNNGCAQEHVVRCVCIVWIQTDGSKCPWRYSMARCLYELTPVPLHIPFDCVFFFLFSLGLIDFWFWVLG